MFKNVKNVLILGNFIEKNIFEEMNWLFDFWFIFVNIKDFRNFLFILDKGFYKCKL